uniref:Isoflavone 2'-hydroxylase-like n=1 Tax=Nelumbo nucifera TaxID=4432 RepID=A0A822ZD47_NELNU|nr:TPA_asm: hypothetical protein HUJ06_015732 [Nelumbo nucifera]
MDVLLYLYYFVLFFLGFLLFSKFQFGKKRKLPPSPLTLPIIGHLYLLFKKPLYRTLAHISNKYGPISFLRFGSRPVLLVSSPSAAEECFTTNDILFANRPRLFAGKYIGYNYSSIAWSSYGNHWRNLRRISTIEILSTTRLQMFSRSRTNEIRSMIRRLASSGSKVVDMKSTFFELTLNVMMMMIAGKRYYGENVGELDKAKHFQDLVTETLYLAGASHIGDYLPALSWIGLNGLKKRMMRLQQKRDEFIQELIEEHRRMKTDDSSSSNSASDSGERQTMIDVLLSLQKAEPEYYTDKIIKGLVLVVFFSSLPSPTPLTHSLELEIWYSGARHEVNHGRTRRGEQQNPLPPESKRDPLLPNETFEISPVRKMFSMHGGCACECLQCDGICSSHPISSAHPIMHCEHLP